MSVPIQLIADHHEALGFWRTTKYKNTDLIHIDAHSDFTAIPPDDPLEILDQSRTIAELKSALEQQKLFSRYGRGKESLVTIGNFVFPAMCEGIVKNFYWIVPGDKSGFKRVVPYVKKILIQNMKKVSKKAALTFTLRNGIVKTVFKGHAIIVTTLDRLPVLRNNVLLDIDTDFFIIPDIRKAAPTVEIGKRQPWIFPRAVAARLAYAIKNPAGITVAYSTRGGYTPQRYVFLGDEIAWRLEAIYNKSAGSARKDRKNGITEPGKIFASLYFNLFELTGTPEFYHEAVALNDMYAQAENNYGLRYLQINKIAAARREFLRVLRADPGNTAANLQLARVDLRQRCYLDARKRFQTIFRADTACYDALLGWAWADYHLGHFEAARKNLLQYHEHIADNGQSYILLGMVYEKLQRYEKSAECYRHAINIDGLQLDVLSRLVRGFSYMRESEKIKGYIQKRLSQFELFLRSNKKEWSRNRGSLAEYQAMKQKYMVIKKRFDRQITRYQYKLCKGGGYEKK